MYQVLHDGLQVTQYRGNFSKLVSGNSSVQARITTLFWHEYRQLWDDFLS